MTNQHRAILYASATVLCWATVATAIKIGLQHQSYAQLLLVASATAMVVFAVDVLRKQKMADLLRLSWRNCLLGALNPALYYLVLFKAYDLLPAQVAQPLNYSWQIVLIILSVPFLGTRLTIKQLLWLLVSFAGVFVVSLQGSFSGFAAGSLFGVVLALGSAFVWGFYWIFNQKWGAGVDDSVKLLLNFFFGFIYLLIYCSIFDNFVAPSFEAIASGVYVGLFEMGISFIFWARALSLSVNRAATVSVTYLSPVLSLILIHFVLGETIFLTSIIGFALVVAGVFFSNRIK